MAAPPINMKFVLTASDMMSRVVNPALANASAKLATLQRQSRSLSQRSSQMGQQMAGAGLALAAGLAVPVRIGMHFEQQMAKVGAVAGANAGQLAAMTAKAREMGATTQFSATEAAGAMEFLAMAGFGVEKSMAALPATLNLAAAGSIGLSEAADIASNILTGFNLQTGQLAATNDVLVNTFTTSNTNLQMLGQTMKFVAPIATTLGASVEQVAGMAGLLGNAGIQADQAGTSMRMMFLRLASPVAKGEKALRRLGITTTDASGNLRSMPDLLAEVGKATSKLATGEQAKVLKNIFGVEASAAAAVLTQRAATGELATYIATLGKAGTSQRVANDLMNTSNGAMLLAKSAGEELALVISDALAPSVKEGFQMLAKLAGQVTAWAKANPALVASIAKGAAALSAFLLVTGAAGLALGGMAAAAAALASPVTLVVIGVAALAAGLTYLYHTNQQAHSSLSGIGAVLREVGTLIAKLVVPQMQALGLLFDGIVNRDFSKVLKGIKTSALGYADFAASTVKMGLGSANTYSSAAAEGAYSFRKQAGTVPKFDTSFATGVAPKPAQTSTLPPPPSRGSVQVEYKPSIVIQGGSQMGEQKFGDMLKEHEQNLMRLIGENQRKAARATY